MAFYLIIKQRGEKFKSTYLTILFVSLLIVGHYRYFKHIILIIIQKGEIVGKSRRARDFE